MRQKKKIEKAIIAVILALMLFYTIFPFLWMVLAAFKSNTDILNPDKLFLFKPTWKNFQSVFTIYSLTRPLINSVFISVVSTALACIVGLPAAYAIARYKQNFFAVIVMMIRMIPAIAYLVPWHIMFSAFKISGTYTALILAYTLSSLPMIIWIMIPYFESIPRELEEAATIDGASNMGSFVRINLPLARPGILTAAILAMIFAWNNFLYALILSGNKTRTLPMALFNFISYTKIEWGGLMAATVVITLPIIVLSLCLQRYVVSGLTAGAVKG